MENLSKREKEVAALLAWGSTDKEIAEELFISFDTARAHHKNIYRKILAHNLADLTRWYFGIQKQSRIVLAVFFLVLTFMLEYNNLIAIRVLTTRVPAKTTKGSKRKNKQTFQYA